MDEVQGPTDTARELIETAAACRERGDTDVILRRVPKARVARPRVIVLCGAPGSGKTTQGKLLASRKKNMVHFSTGDYFRAQIAANTELGVEAAKYLDADLFVPDTLVLRVVMDFIRANIGQVVVLDGMPRTVCQAALLNDACNVLKVVYMHVSKETCVDRIRTRAIESKESRGDQDEAQTQKRLVGFQATLGAVLDQFRSKVAVASADGGVEETYANVEAALDQIVTNEPCFCECKIRLANQLALPCGHCNRCAICVQRNPQCSVCKMDTDSCVSLGPDNRDADAERKGATDCMIHVTSSLVEPLKHNRTQVCFRVNVAEAQERVGQHIIAVVDVSGSMSGTKAQQEDDDGELVDLQYTLLDAVKYSLKALLKCMVSTDRFSLVLFSSDASTLMECQPMTDDNVERAIALVDCMQAEGTTNLWAGLHRGLEIVQRSYSAKSQLTMRSTIVLLTDGVPDQGCDGVQPFRAWQSKVQDKNIPFELVTFGYGSKLKMNVLFELAELGHGNYIWIPSSSETGSIFVKFMANACCICAQDVTLHVQTTNQSQIVTYPKGFYQNAIVQRNVNGCIVQLGSVRFGQSQEVVLDMRIPNTSDVYANVRVFVGQNEVATLQANSFDITHDAIAAHARLLMCHQLRKAVHDSVDASYHIEESVDYLESVAETLPVAAFYLKDLKGEQVQLENGTTVMEGGKIAKGAQREKFARWGCHLIPSYLTTHQRKLCTNLYEVGCMPYNTPWTIAFTSMGKRFYEDFAPTAAAPAAVAPKPMVSYHYTSTPAPTRTSGFSGGGCGSCIAGDCIATVRNANGLIENRRIERLRVGDWVRGEHDEFSQIKFVLKKTAPTPLYDFQCGLRLSERHPFRDVGASTWRRAEHEFTHTTSVEDVVYNFVLWTGHVMLVNGMVCLCLGHDLADPMVSHPLYASSAAMSRACKTLTADIDHTFAIVALKRDTQGRVCGFLQ